MSWLIGSGQDCHAAGGAWRDRTHGAGAPDAHHSDNESWSLVEPARGDARSGETGVRDIGPYSRPRAAPRRSRRTTTQRRQRPRSRKFRDKFESMLYPEKQLYNNDLMVAEGVGFEPTVPIRHNGFRDRPIQPLSHPTVKVQHTVKSGIFNTGNTKDHPHTGIRLCGRPSAF